MKNIFLIGFMGTGKSTVARHMQQKYGMEIVEMDETIETREGMRISKIFEKYGEPYFRDRETALLREIEAKENVVVSCGGGVVLREENVEIMKKSGDIVLLTASPETILRRVRNDEKRPLLKGKKNVHAIRELMEARREHYEKAADMIVCVDEKQSWKVCGEIIRKRKELEKESMKKRIILASASPRRKEIMEQAGYTFEIMVSNREERFESTKPDDVVRELAVMKAEDVADQCEKKNIVIIGADTVVAHRGKILGKPTDEEAAFAMIRGMQGDVHNVYTGVAILAFDSEGNKTSVNAAVGTKVYVDAMTDVEIRSYLATGEYKDKAGGYAIQGKFAPYIEKIEGDYYNVVGLPISWIRKELKKLQ